MATLHHMSGILMLLGLTPCLLGQELQPCTTEQQLLGDVSCLYTDGDAVWTKDQHDVLFGQKSTKSKRQAHKPSVLWPGGVIPFEFAPGDFNEEDRFRVEEAIYLWEFGTCLKFRPATSDDESKIRFQDGKSCSSPFGMQKGVSKITLSRFGCRNRGTYLHEMGHTLGMVHTHLRPDRDDHIEIKHGNVSKHLLKEFNKYSSDKLDLYDIPYDYASVMHYGSRANSRNGVFKTIVALDPKYQKYLDYVMYKWLSFYDIKLANLMYQCNKHCPADPKCKAPGYLNKDCKCTCPNGKDCGYGVMNCPTDYQDPRCDEWFEKGECKRSLGGYIMALHCPRRCDCDDNWVKKVCDTDAKAGKCATNKKFMLNWCKLSCNACKKDPPISAGCPTFKLFKTPPTPPPTTTPGPTTTTERTLGNCKNKATERRCEPLALRGDCETSPWMRLNCPKSCNTCPGSCVDLRTERECEGFKNNGQCKTKERWMRKNCLKTCNLCGVRQECQDDDNRCESWEKAGYCRTSAPTAQNCRKTCGLCK